VDYSGSISAHIRFHSLMKLDGGRLGGLCLTNLYFCVYPNSTSMAFI
jgi:hypothetical protein